MEIYLYVVGFVGYVNVYQYGKLIVVYEWVFDFVVVDFVVIELLLGFIQDGFFVVYLFWVIFGFDWFDVDDIVGVECFNGVKVLFGYVYFDEFVGNLLGGYGLFFFVGSLFVGGFIF